MCPRRIRLAAVLAALVSCGWSALAQSADGAGHFAGRWILVDAKPVRPGYEQFWMGTEVVISQGAEAFEIVRVAPAPERRASFVLGKETRNAYVVDGKNLLRDSRATMRDGLLLISTDTTTDTEPRRRTNIMRWSIEPDGTLAINDTEMCGKGECPSIITNLRFRKK
jgi:hypothetical protein